MDSIIRKNQQQQILEYMYDHTGISNTEAVTKLHIGRLSGRIKDLRDDGWDIVTNMVRGENSRYAYYTFTKHQRGMLCKCPDCGHVYDFNDSETYKESEGCKVKVYTECPRCREWTCEYEYEEERPYGERYGTNVWAGREV